MENYRVVRQTFEDANGNLKGHRYVIECVEYVRRDEGGFKEVWGPAPIGVGPFLTLEEAIQHITKIRDDSPSSTEIVWTQWS